MKNLGLFHGGKMLKKLSLFVFLVFFSLIPNLSAASGDLDRSFGFNGLAFFDTPFSASAVSVQSDDRILLGGSCFEPGVGDHFCLIRLTATGQVDPTFAGGNFVVTQMGPNGSEASRIVKIIPLADGKIIVAGYTDRTVQSTRYSLVAIARFMPNGTLDTTFAGQGKFFDTATSQPTGMQLTDVALQPDGKIVVLAGNPSFGSPRIVVMRLSADGVLDPTFGTGGRASRDYGSLSDFPGSVSLGPDGKITVGGRGFGNQGFDYVVERYLANGDYDVSAGQGGRVRFSVGANSPQIRKVAVLANGSTVAMGNSANFGNPLIMVSRFKQDLSFDPTFGNAGLLQTQLAPNQSCDPLDFLLKDDGRITLNANCIISSSTFNGASQELARLGPNGQLDRQFGDDGRVSRLYRSYTGQLAVQSTGRIVACGRTTFQSGPSQGLFCERYLDNGTRESDFDADNKADVGVFRPSTGIWYSNGSKEGFRAGQFGSDGDNIVPADYDGDGVIDYCVFRQGVWYQLLSSTNSFRIFSYGFATDIPLAADYSGDGKADMVAYRDGDWYILDSVTLESSFVHYGLPGDKPQVGNFDGDLRADPAVYRSGIWHVLGSSTGASQVSFGLSDDRPVPADYDGDGSTDLAVYRNGTWHVLGSLTGYRVSAFGLATDRPTPADYDGDGRADFAVFRDGVWYLFQSTAGFAAINFGLAEDIPIPASF